MAVARAQARELFRRGRGKIKATPRLRLSSDIVEIIDTPLFVERKTLTGLVKERVTLQEWWNSLTAKQREKARRLAEKRHLLMTLFRNSALSEADIARTLGLTRQRVTQLKAALMPERETFFTGARAKADEMIALAKANPALSWSEIRRRMGLSGNRRDSSKVVGRIGFRKRSSIAVQAENEQPLRKKWLDDKGIYYNPKKPVQTSLYMLQRRYSNMRRRWKYKASKYIPFLSSTIPTIDRNIAHLERCGIDWRDERLNGLVSNTPAYIDIQLSVLDSVRASSDLHYVLLKTLPRKVENYGKKKFADLRDVIVGKDLRRLEDFANGLVKRGCDLSQITPSLNLFEIGRETMRDVFSKCKYPERNPPAFLAIASAAIEVALNDEFVRHHREINESDLPERRRARVGYY